MLQSLQNFLITVEDIKVELSFQITRKLLGQMLAIYKANKLYGYVLWFCFKIVNYYFSFINKPFITGGIPY